MKNVLIKMQTYLLGAIVLAALIGSVGWDECFAAESFPTLVTTKLGQLEGFYSSEHTVAWYGVPFAKPPIGDLRWRAPQPPDAWDGVRDATYICEPCMQKTNTPMDDLSEFFEYFYEGKGESRVIGSEDCLYMNIFRPKTAAENLPVYVFIHGGANTLGSIGAYDGSILAEKANMIVIFAQYRLGPLGYFSHPVLRNGTSLADDSGSFGTLDNVQALKWIQENISAFGGNPQNVTVAGESGGGLNVMNMLISPMAKGLFHKAMAQSPAGINYTRQEAELFSNRTIELLLENDGYTNEDWDSWNKAEKAAYLRVVNNEDLVEICTDNLLMSQPIQSRGVIPGNIVSGLRTGDYNKVPVILGTNKYESKLMMGGPLVQPIFRIPSWAELPQVLSGEKSLDDLFPNQFDRDLYETTADYGSRFWRFQAVDDRARVMNEHQDDIYAYRFDWGGPEPFNFVLGAAHGMEVHFFLGADRASYDMWTPESDTDGRRELMDIMITYLANFAATGNPNGENVPVWQRWSNDANGPKVVLLDADEDQATIEMSYEEIDIRDIKMELRNEIAQWPLMEQVQHGLTPYILPMAFYQLQPEQIVMDFGIFGEYPWNTGAFLRKMMFTAITSGNANTALP